MKQLTEQLIIGILLNTLGICFATIFYNELINNHIPTITIVLIFNGIGSYILGNTLKKLFKQM